MAEVRTNRDLYCFVAGLVREHSEYSGTLQTYLENLRRLGRSLGEREAVSPEEFSELLRAAFNPELSAAEPRPTVTDGYTAWEKRIADQIRDLDDMRQAGILDDESRYFGVDAPRGARWYNFEPCAYLECAAAGTFGGWQEGDDTGRSYVPGPVAVLDPSGEITSVDPRDIDDPVIALPAITWEIFVEFLNAGQWYE